MKNKTKQKKKKKKKTRKVNKVFIFKLLFIISSVDVKQMSNYEIFN